MPALSCKRILLSALLPVTALSCTAQQWLLQGSYGYGATSSYNVHAAPGRTWGHTWYAGAGFTCFLSGHIGVGSGIRFSSYDYDMRYNRPGLLVHRQQQHFAELPLLLTWRRQAARPQGFRPVLTVTAGILVSRLMDATYKDYYIADTVSGSNRSDFRRMPVKAYLCAGWSQDLWQRGAVTLGVSFSSLLQDNIVNHPSVVRFLPGSLAAVALQLGIAYYLPQPAKRL